MQNTGEDDEETPRAIEESIRQVCKFCTMTFENMDQHQYHIAFECPKIYGSREDPDTQKQSRLTKKANPSTIAKYVQQIGEEDLVVRKIPNTNTTLLQSDQQRRHDHTTNNAEMTRMMATTTNYSLNETKALQKKLKACSSGIGRFGDAVSETPIRRRQFGDRRFGDGTFWRPPVRRWDVSATASSATGRFGDRTFRRRDISAIGCFGDGKFRRWDFSATKKSCVK